MRKGLCIIPVERIDRVIVMLRGHRVILDEHLAAIYGVTTARLNQQVRRNIERLPSGFSFPLTSEEYTNLKLQFATSSSEWGGRRKLPLAFMEHGALMASSVLITPIAVAASIQVVRTFVRLRQILASNRELAGKLAELEENYDSQFKVVFDAIRHLMTPPPQPERPPMGFHVRS